jgi:hypothetical protein
VIRNTGLIDRAKSFIRHNKDKDEAVAMLIEKYEVACGLSTGPVPARSQVWEGNAAKARQALCQAIGYQE